MPKPPFPRLPTTSSGAALVLILLAILALSSLVVLFFSLASNDRSNTGAYAQGMKADELASGGLELIVDKLREEISHPDRSSVSTSTPTGMGPTIYSPKEPEYILPDATVTVSSTAPSNLIKISSATRPISQLASGTSLASNASTATPSRNGRAVTADRWSKPQLETFGSGTGAPIPDWIYFDRRGPVVNPTLSNTSNSESAEFVTGRIAFAVYDVGGLIDINVAGYPLAFPATEAGKKGSPAFVRLQSLGIPEAAIEKILTFRNPKSATDSATYLSYVQNADAHQGFTKTVAGDNRFLSRQELVRFAKQNGFADQLPLLTIFSREKNAPSYAPDPSIPAATAPPATNPSLATARHAASGRLLFEQRFPLNKIKLLAELRASPGSAELAEAVKAAFGLTYDSGTRQFSYHGPGSSTRTEIKTLAQIGAEPDYRTPDFFETLKSVIHAGSLGQSAGTTATTPDQDDADSQIIRIGTSIIDQYDTDYIPTAVYFGTSTTIPIWGVENLPYVNKLQIIGQDPNTQGIFGSAEGGTRNNFNADGPPDYRFRWAVELWNPHVQKLPLSDSLPDPDIKVALGPTGARARVDVFPNTTASDVPGKLTGVPGAISAAECSNQFNIATGYGREMGPSIATYYRSFFDPRQVFFGEVNDKTNPIPRPKNDTDPTKYKSIHNSAKLNLLDPIYVDLFVQDTDGFLHHYFRTWPITYPHLLMTNSIQVTSSFMQSDPRTNRMGMFSADWRPNHAAAGAPTYPTNISVATRYAWPIRISQSTATSESVRATDALQAPSEGYTGTAIYPALLYENTEASTQFADPDGVVRAGDGGFAPGEADLPPTAQLNTNPAANPPATASVSSRPKFLDRPFRSVAELGYVFRDAAWKSLNFSGTDSADAALLDAFSIDGESVIAGKASLNSRHPEVWESILANSLQIDDDETSVLTSPQARSLAVKITDHLSDAANSPMVNISEVVTKLSLPENFSPAEFGSNANRAVKTRREAAIRAISGNIQSRTWNLLIDIVAQSGRFPRNASSLDQFIVEGERRCWLHLAIDRYTGEIIDEQMETILE